MIKKIFTIALSIFFISSIPIGNALPSVDDWPMHSHDPENSGYVTSAAPETDNTFFDVQISSNTIALSSPIVVDDKIYINEIFGKFYCVDAIYGEILWQKDFGAGLSSDVAVVDGYIYTYSGQRCLYDLNDNGVVGYDDVDIIKAHYGLDSEDPLFNGLDLDDNGVIGGGDVNRIKANFGSCSGYSFSCYSVEDPTVPQWRFPCGRVDGSSPTVLDDKIYFGDSEKKLHCLNTDGIELWNFTAIDKIYSTPAIVDNRVYFSSQPNKYSGPSTIYCLDAADDGSEIWSYANASRSKSPVVYDGMVYVGLGDTVVCLDAEGNGNGTTSLIWHYKIIGAAVTSPAIYGDKIYFGTNANELFCLDAQGDGYGNGEVVWSFEADNPIQSSPVAADGKIYFNAVRDIYCLDADGTDYGTTNLFWRKSCGASLQNQPTIANGNVWVVSYGLNIIGFRDRPNAPNVPTGQTDGETGVDLTFTAVSTDVGTNEISYFFSWNDATESEWTEYLPSGIEVTAMHSWIEAGTYTIKVKVKDVYGVESEWSPPLKVTIGSHPTDPVLLPDLHISCPASIVENEIFIVTITDDDTPIENVIVEFNNKIKFTDGNGQVRFIAPKVFEDSEYILSATRVGYIDDASSITVLDNPETQGWVWGLVKDADSNEEIDGAKVCAILTGSDSRCTFTTEHTDNYNYYLPLPLGKFTITVSKGGYSTRFIYEVEIQAGITQNVNFVLEKSENEPSDDNTQEEIWNVTKTGHVGAIITIEKENKPIVEYYTDEEISINEIQQTSTSIELTVDAVESTPGRFFVIYIADEIFSETQLKVELGGELMTTMPVENFLNPQETNESGYVIISSRNGKYIVVYLPHFSQHTITISSILEKISRILLAKIYVIMFLLAAVITVYSVVFSGTFRFRIKKRR